MRSELQYKFLGMGCVTAAFVIWAIPDLPWWPTTFLVLTGAYFQNRCEWTRPMKHREVVLGMFGTFLAALLFALLVKVSPDIPPKIAEAFIQATRTLVFVIPLWLLAMGSMALRLRKETGVSGAKA